MKTKTSRRAVLTGAAALPAAIVASRSIARGDDALNKVWAKRAAAVTEYRRLQPLLYLAEEKLPDGDPALRQRSDDLINAVLEIEDKLRGLPKTPTSIAAAILVETQFHAFGSDAINSPNNQDDLIPAMAGVLTPMREFVARGPVRDAVDEFLDNPKKPIAMMSFALFGDDFEIHHAAATSASERAVQS